MLNLLKRYNTAAIAAALDKHGFAVMPALFNSDQCAELRASYDQADTFRSTVVMQHHGFGQGEYSYFRYPLPDELATLRAELYHGLVPVANRWSERLGFEYRYPGEHADFIEQCHTAGQHRPTPLLLRYRPGDFNCLHQDLYGPLAFPLQLTVMLSQPGEDFIGGEFTLVEQRPRRQSRVEVVPLHRGDAVIFPSQFRPQAGTRGDYRLTLRHGVSRVRSGERFTLGIIFHDAE